MTALGAHVNTVEWNHNNQLVHVELMATNQDVYFAYDGAGQRVRKVHYIDGATKERIYFGAYEIYRYKNGGGLDTERQTFHVMNDERRVTTVETKTWSGGSQVTTPEPKYRYQLDNHLGTACVEVNESAQVISYEEYHPYGTTAYRAQSSTEVSAKRYRYTAKERDDETGLYYHGARYYAPWLGRWTEADPIANLYVNLYIFCLNNPVKYVDDDGKQPANKDAWMNIAEKNKVGEKPIHARILIQSFKDKRISGKSPLERFNAILKLTESKGKEMWAHMHFNETIDDIAYRPPNNKHRPIGDYGFRRELRDSVRYREAKWLHPNSSNQIGHFLTAADLGYSLEKEKPSAYERITSWKARISVGHEIAGDKGPDFIMFAKALMFAKAYLAPSTQDMINFFYGDLSKIKLDTWKEGSSYQDLLLTRIGWRFGKHMANNRFSNRKEAARWLEMMLTPKGNLEYESLHGKGVFREDANWMKKLIKDFKTTQPVPKITAPEIKKQ
jgi:RHS repeat-associated protein